MLSYAKYMMHYIISKLEIGTLAVGIAKQSDHIYTAK